MNTIRRMARSLWGRLVIASLILLGFGAGTKLAFDAVLYQQNIRQLSELNRQTLHRMELAADYAVITLSELAVAGLSQCTAASLQEIRRVIYLRGAIKDVQVLGENNQLRCAALPAARSLGVANFDMTDGYASQNTSITFYHLGVEDAGLLGVAWRFRSDLTFMAILNVDSLMFDVFPMALRDQAQAELMLGEGAIFARHISDAQSSMPIMDPVHFESESERYPLRASFTLGAKSIGAWNGNLRPYAVATGSVLGLVLAIFAFAILSRPISQRQAMEEGLRDNEFQSFLQPIFSIDGRKIVGCEMLARWIKPDGQIVSPVKFIPFAEESGLITPMTRFLMGQTLRQLSPIMRADKAFKVNFNVVPADMVADGFADNMCALAEEHGVARRQIVLELTERQGFDDQAKAVSAIEGLQALGFRVALDDTGTGHNGLTHVQELNVDIIKIDKRFIDFVGIDKSATAIVSMLVRLAQDLGMTTVAEGIETEAQRIELAGCGVDEGQGYLVSPAVPAAQFLALLTEHAKSARVLNAA